MFNEGNISFDSPVSYRIVVQGILHDSILPFVEGMKVVKYKSPTGIHNTSISGTFKDQAYLTGIINILYENHYEILLVEHISDNSSKSEME